MVLILTQCFFPMVGGIENYLFGMAHALVKKNYKVIVYADSHSEAKDDSFPFLVRRFGGIKFVRRYLKAYAAKKLLQQGDIGHIICDSWKSLEKITDIPKNIQIIVLAHGSEYPLSATPRKIERITKSLSKAHRVLAASQATKKRMETIGIDTASVEIYHPPIEEPVDVLEENKAWTATFWKNKTPRLLSLGRLVKRKGIASAICAIGELIDDYPDLCYLIAGEGEEKMALQQLVKKLKLESHIHFLGGIDNQKKVALYESADAFILPSYQVLDDMEGYGLVFIEAGAWNTPAIAGRAGGSAEAVEDGKTGYHCNGEEVSSVKNAIIRLLENKEKREIMGKNARVRAEKEFWCERIKTLL